MSKERRVEERRKEEKRGEVERGNKWYHPHSCSGECPAVTHKSVFAGASKVKALATKAGPTQKGVNICATACTDIHIQ